MRNLLTPLLVSFVGLVVNGQFNDPGVGYPHDYPGMPKGDYSPAWQSYFQVTKSLPNVTWPLPRNWAGNIGVDRTGHPNNTLFFWAFEKEKGSFTAAAEENQDKPWGIWLNGGPGTSSLFGLMLENGPIHVASDYSLYPNTFAWNELADYVWLDQPVGTGFSTVDTTGWVADEDQMGVDFFNFLDNFVKVFPSLRTRPLYITGESYAGTYIPYIMKTYFGMKNPPVNLVKVAIGNGAIGSENEYDEVPVITILETYPQLIGYDTEVFQYFREQAHLCGLDLNLTYPQHGHFPSLDGLPSGIYGSAVAKRQASLGTLLRRIDTASSVLRKRVWFSDEQIEKKRQWKRDLTGRANGTIDPWYGCDLYGEMQDYAFNFSLPWQGTYSFDVYDVPQSLFPGPPMDASVFLNDDATRAALHAPTSKNWSQGIVYPFGGAYLGDPSPYPTSFMSELATNASRKDVGIVIYSGNDDSLCSHRSSEVVIQNTTFGGIQGFTRRPSTHWYDDDGHFAGIVHQERNWTYVLVNGTGHYVPQGQPESAYVLLREFILGNNKTGLVTQLGGETVVIGGEDKDFSGVLTGQAGIYTGSAATQYTYTYPSATIGAWETFIAEATATP